MQHHVQIGMSILSGSHSPILELSAQIALTHHEWWDGSGYLTGLAGTDIPTAGRIVAVADVFDALTHDRPYKKAWTVEAALEEIRGLSGRQFDAEVVEAFETLEHSDLLAPVGTDGGPVSRLAPLGELSLTAGSRASG
jgi:HD-GYP domain-containing protein (c-di-GMP phosphodiesterase class II)